MPVCQYIYYGILTLVYGEKHQSIMLISTNAQNICYKWSAILVWTRFWPVKFPEMVNFLILLSIFVKNFCVFFFLKNRICYFVLWRSGLEFIFVAISDPFMIFYKNFELVKLLKILKVFFQKKKFFLFLDGVALCTFSKGQTYLA